MKELRRRRGLSGTVLIMILTVMTVLIIMLLATLTVVTTANQRVYTKFEENQAYYSARSALDVFTQNMLADAAYKADDGARTYTHGNGESAPMKQGLGLQLDLYAIKAQEGTNIEQSVLTSFMGTSIGSALEKDEYNTWFGTDTTNVLTNGLPATNPDYKEYMQYEVEFPEVSGDGNAYGKLSGTVGKGDTNKAIITVEVLKRKYNLGQYHTSPTAEAPAVPSGDEEAFISKSATSPSGANYSSVTDDMIAEALVRGSRKKDTMSVKITATTSFEGVEGVAVLFYDTNEPPTNNSSRAITAFGAMNGTNHAYIVGGVSMVGSAGDMAPMRNGGGVFGIVYDEMGLDFNVSSPIYLTEMEYVFVGGDFKGDNDINIQGAVPAAAAGDKNKRPFIFVGGKLYPQNQFKGIGGTTAAQAVDLITLGGIEWYNNSFGINGDIYSNGSCTFNSSAAKPDINGELYIKGDLTVGGNVCTVVDDTITLHFGSNCNIHVSGNVYQSGNATPFAHDKVSSDGTYAQFTNTADMVLPTVAQIQDTTTGDMDVDVKLPGGVNKKIETHRTNYDEYYYIDGGNYVDADGNPSATPVRRSAQSLAAVNFTDTSLVPTDKLTISNQTIDTAGGITKLWYDGSGNGNGVKIEVTGGGTLELYLYNPWGNDFGFNNGAYNFIIDDDTTLKVFGVNMGDYYFDKVRFLTKTVYDALPPTYGGTGAELNAGSQSGFGIKVPKIYYYFANSGKQINLNNGECFLTGYVFAPDSKLYASGGSNISFGNLKYNGASVPSSWKFTILGSLLCNDFEFQNDHGVIYVNPALADDGDAGEPIHNFAAYRYARG